MSIAMEAEAEELAIEKDLRETTPSDFSEVEKHLSETNVMFDSVKTLDGISGSLKGALADGGMTPQSAEALNIAVEHFCTKCNIPKTKVFCVEQFQGMHARKKAIAIGMENISSIVMTVVRKIVTYIKKIYEFVYDDIENTARGAAAVTNKALLLQELAIKKQVLNNGNSKKTINKKSLVTYFNEEGTALSFSEIQKRYEDYSREVNNSFSGTVLHNTLATVINNMQHAIKEIGKGNISNENALKASNAGVIYLKDHAFNHFKPIEKINDNEALGYKLPFGNASLAVALGKDGDYYNSVSIDLIQDKNNECKDIVSLTPKEVIIFTKMVESQMHSGIYRDFLKIKAQIKEIGKIVTETCNSVTKAQYENSSAAIPSLNFLKSLTGSLMIMTKMLYSYNGAMNRAILSYCEQSLANWD